MPLQQTSGNATADGFGGGVPVARTYIEDVFSAYTYTGNGSTQTITNGIDLAGKGGMVWSKERAAFGFSNALQDTVQGTGAMLSSNSTNGAAAPTNAITAFNNNGYTIGNLNGLNYNLSTFVSWTFRKAPKFFDVVTYTGNGTTQNIAHSLGSVPGMIIIKATSTTGNWAVYHNGLATPNNNAILLNTTGAAQGGGTDFWNTTTPTATVFSLGTGLTVNTNGTTYVAYLFAHDTSADGLIQCGSFTTDGVGKATVNLGWEPQYILYKSSTTTTNWAIADTSRGLTSAVAQGPLLYANTSGAESDSSTQVAINATGFTYDSAPSQTFIYMAIRRGPMKVPTDATKVFSPKLALATAGTFVSTGFPVDLQIASYRPGNNPNFAFSDRLRGVSTNATDYIRFLASSTTNPEATVLRFRSLGWDNTGYKQDAYLESSGLGIYWNFRRAPGFFDEVCYTGTGANTTVAHGLGVVPELMIVKKRSGDDSSVWGVWYGDKPLAGDVLYLNLTNGWDNNPAYFNSTTPTTSVFSIGTSASTNANASTYVAYLFATCAGVSKVGSYTGNGTTQTINCGFSGGARFVLIKRTDATGDWYGYDTARGMTVLVDPYSLLNTTAAEVATLGSVTTVATGFALNSAILAAINVNTGTYIYLAIA